MPDPNDTPTPDTTPKKKTLAEVSAERDTIAAERDALAAEIERRNADALRADELAKARADERAKLIADGAPPRLLGTIPVYLQDDPDDVLARARDLMRGQIPADRARRFKIDARLSLSAKWPDRTDNKLHARYGATPPIGVEFDAADMPTAERIEYVRQGAIIAIG